MHVRFNAVNNEYRLKLVHRKRNLRYKRKIEQCQIYVSKCCKLKIANVQFRVNFLIFLTFEHHASLCQSDNLKQDFQIADSLGNITIKFLQNPHVNFLMFGRF